MREIDLSQWTKSGEGYEADSYNNNQNEDIMLKLYRPHILKERIVESFEATNEILRLGINTPKVFEIVSFEDRLGVIYERIKNKSSLFRIFVNEHEKAKEIGHMFGNAIKDFHSHKIDTEKFVSRYSILYNRAKGMLSNLKILNDNQKDEALKKIDVFFEKYKETENDNTCLVGDAHIGNVILANEKLYFIDLASVQYGNPLLEIGWIYAGAFNKQVDAILPKEEFVPLKYKQIFWDEFVHTYYEGMDEKTIFQNVEKAKLYADIQDLFIKIYINPSYDSIMEVLTK